MSTLEHGVVPRVPAERTDSSTPNDLTEDSDEVDMEEDYDD